MENKTEKDYASVPNQDQIEDRKESEIPNLSFKQKKKRKRIEKSIPEPIFKWKEKVIE